MPSFAQYMEKTRLSRKAMERGIKVTHSFERGVLARADKERRRGQDFRQGVHKFGTKTFDPVRMRRQRPSRPTGLFMSSRPGLTATNPRGGRVGHAQKKTIPIKQGGHAGFTEGAAQQFTTSGYRDTGRNTLKKKSGYYRELPKQRHNVGRFLVAGDQP